MALRGLVGLFSGRPQHAIGADGRMALSDHFREFRARLLRSLLVFAVLFALAVSVWFGQLYEVVYGPAEDVKAILPKGQMVLSTSGIAGGLMMRLKLAGFAALVLSAPFWLYQIWAFVMPGLHSQEKKWSRVFAAVAGPLFLVGVALGYVTFAKALEVLIGFNEDGLTNITDFDSYLSFFTRTMLVFGISLLIPVFVVLLNLVGVVKGSQLARSRPWIIVGTFVFAAVATPSADPFTMTIMAIPMVLLFFLSEAIARVSDRRRLKRAAARAALSPDEASVL